MLPIGGWDMFICGIVDLTSKCKLMLMNLPFFLFGACNFVHIMLYLLGYQVAKLLALFCSCFDLIPKPSPSVGYNKGFCFNVHP